MKQNVFVVRNGDGWGVRTGGATRLSRAFGTQAEAFKYGRAVAMHKHTELRMQRMNGQFGVCNSYGADSCPPRDKNR